MYRCYKLTITSKTFSTLFLTEKEKPNIMVQIVTTSREISSAEFVRKYTKEFQSFRRLMVGLVYLTELISDCFTFLEMF